MSKILWHSNAGWAASGYGQQTATFVPRFIERGHDVAISAFWGLKGSPIPYGIPYKDGYCDVLHYPGDGEFGNRTLPLLANMHGGEDCLVISLLDVFAMDGRVMSGLNMACWVPIDHDPIPPAVHGFFHMSGARPIAMSRFGERKLAEVGLDPLYVPHGIDTQVFHARPEGAAAMRDLLGIPQDAFVVGMAAANVGNTPSRKGFPRVVEAFKALLDKHPDAVLYLHTDMEGKNRGVDLAQALAVCEVPPESVWCTPPDVYEFGIQPERLAEMYSMFDVLANPAYGEGFGICTMEAQACGTPVIVSDCTAMPELAGPGSYIVDAPRWYDPLQGSFYGEPSVGEVAEAMIAAYDRGRDHGFGEQLRDFALAYDADAVMEKFWVPALERLSRPKPKVLKGLPYPVSEKAA